MRQSHTPLPRTGSPHTLTLAVLRHRLRADYQRIRNWRLVAEAYGVSKGLAYRIAVEGYEPKSAALRRKLHLPLPTARVIPIDGAIPDGAQAPGAKWCVICGRSYISNHPRRRRCYDCSPPRGANGAQEPKPDTHAAEPVI